MSEQPTYEITARVAANVRTLRQIRRWSAEHLAERMAAVGCPVSRSAIANQEVGRRRHVTVEELVGFAAVFGIEPADLLAEKIAVACPRCAGDPPAGYQCLACGEGSDHSAVGGKPEGRQ